MKQELISISNQPAVIDVNFEELKAALAKDLEKYDVVVTAETVSGAKKLASELNATKNVISQRRKDEVAKASEPVRQFDQQMKDLASMCEDGRQNILGQVKVFEDETRDLAASLLAALLAKLNDEHGVEHEFRKAQFGDLVKLSAVTAKGNLTAAASKDLDARVRDDKAMQDRTKMRLLELENKSHMAGLAAPLTRDHVQHFLFADDDQYSAELQRILDAEVERQQVAERRQREQMEREQRQREEAQRNEEERQERMAQQEQSPESEPAPEPRQEPAKFDPPKDHAPVNDNGRVDCTVTCTFSTEVATGVSAEAIEAELRKVMARAGITTLASVYVQLGAMEAAE
ncbi:DUF1351 domain-containing protein [Alcanivorax jadensis]|uniref:DUF1351 domain-containing protein n=1 Tax=Alcanivorax jadensis TaxID=64988 RepID=UPI002352D600|nr:DUF1351 domain-containing protein [Alcanivorax jadensis]|tara:strand:+ start:684 stop:1718 length:1035 start_codon:yes stop_codon:yes gene_type:complete